MIFLSFLKLKKLKNIFKIKNWTDKVLTSLKLKNKNDFDEKLDGDKKRESTGAFEDIFS